jgi:hypothetical protein
MRNKKAFIFLIFFLIKSQQTLLNNIKLKLKLKNYIEFYILIVNLKQRTFFFLKEMSVKVRISFDLEKN